MIQKIKKILKSCSKSLMFTYFLIIMVLLLPNALVMPSLSFKSLIITAIGIEGSPDNIEMSILALSNISKTNMLESTKVISGQGQTLANAVFSIERQVGRSIRMGHVGYIVISKELTDNDITNILNNLIVTTKLPTTISLIICQDSAKDVLSSASKLEQTSSFKLREMIQNEYNEDYVKETSLDSFLKGYYSPNSSSSIGYVSINQNELTGIAVDNSQPDDSSSSSSLVNQNSGENESGGQEQKVISYKSEQAVFKNGKYMYVLSKDEMEGLNFIVENNLQKLITIRNVNTQGLKNATITFDVISEQLKASTSIKNNKPQILFNIALKLKTMEIIDENDSKISFEKIVIDEEINQKIRDFIKQKISILLKKVRAEKTDIINIYNYFESSNYSKFMTFLGSLEDKDDYLSYIQIKANVNTKLSTN